MTAFRRTAAAHRQPGAQPDRAGLRARPRRASGRPHRLLHPPERSRRRRRQGRRHEGREPGQAAPAGADARAGQRRREPARDDRRDRRRGATPRRRSSSRIRAIRTTTWRWSTSWRRPSPARPGVRRARRRACAMRWPTSWRRRRADGRPDAPRPLPDLARPVDDGGARHLHLAHARPHRLADAARRGRRLRRRGALPGA